MPHSSACRSHPRVADRGDILSLFIAVFPNEDARLDLKRQLPAHSRPTRPEKWHITLAFLNAVPDDRAEDVARALSDVPPPGPITLHLTGGGRFGTVLWAGLAGDVDALAAFRQDLRSALIDAGFPIDERPFRPHLTVSYRFDHAIHRALHDYAGPSWPVTEFSLVRSADSEYHRLHTWPARPAD
ncbi:RNA 2',3'-cyclic phosphodiesterase [Actinoplanes sp. GCM10030250]|uniref:RNA 2',3'-cyclic phosphodiesterase n=1 Tax=Actinoplanes sp. GCM10030250 TaxID=3273376 RepID=UPI00361D7057